jgi:hypothetical protein
MADSPPPRLVTFEEIQRVLRDIRPDVLSDAISAGGIIHICMPSPAGAADSCRSL